MRPLLRGSLLVLLLGGCATAGAGVRPVELQPPFYPSMLRAQAVEGIVRFEVAITTDGAPDLRTWRAVEATHALFTAAAKRAMPSWRWPVASTPHPRTVTHLVRWMLLPADTTLAVQCPAGVAGTTVVCARRVTPERRSLH